MRTIAVHPPTDQHLQCCVVIKKKIKIPCSENSWVNYLLPQGDFLGMLLLLSLLGDYLQQNKGEF